MRAVKIKLSCISAQELDRFCASEYSTVLPVNDSVSALWEFLLVIYNIRRKGLSKASRPRSDAAGKYNNTEYKIAENM